MIGRIPISEVGPVVECGRWPAKAATGERVTISATVFREGHDAVAANVVWSPPDDTADGAPFLRMERYSQEPDRWIATVVPDREGRWSFCVEAWSDPLATWHHAVEVKIAAGQGAEDLANDLEEGARLLDRVAGEGPAEHKAAVETAAASLRDTSQELTARVAPAFAPGLQRVLHDHPVREMVTRTPRYEVWVDRPRALYGSWYEYFPRSEGAVVGGKPVHGTFTTAAAALDRVAKMGFDVVYLPPIHPIGRVNRKGPNNTLDAKPDDVGSPWAIGADEGGHDAIHPDLGTFDDFDAFVARTEELGMEVALDFALQAAPDHPWVLKNPEFFTTRPDGSIAYAENPPKKYQDIYPINFDNDPKGVYEEMLRVITVWIDHGVKIFRVDNPHTKPPDFWAWLIQSVKDAHPDVIFLAEAFTRPARLWGLARLGFTQSYTYFTWRTGKQELIDFAVDLRDHWNEGRPNLFVNTPDILHESLQRGGPGMFALRAALAATISPTWGVYSGYELFEHVPVREGSEEYLDSEKYQLRPRDFDRALAEGRSLEPWLAKLNAVRRAHPALQQMRTLHFHHIDNDALLAYSKQDPATGDTVVTVVTLDPYGPQEGTLWLDTAALGFEAHERLIAHDEVTGDTWDWGPANYVRLEPWRAVAHVVSVRRRLAG